MANEYDETIWFSQPKYEHIETVYQMNLAGTNHHGGRHHKKSESDHQHQNGNNIRKELQNARQNIRNALDQKSQHNHHGGGGGRHHGNRGRNSRSNSGMDQDVHGRVNVLEKENRELKHKVNNLQSLIHKLESRVAGLEINNKAPSTQHNQTPPAVHNGAGDLEDDDDVDLFGSDDEEDAAEAEKVKQERLAAYADKKAKKPGLIAKSSIVLDVKPWDDETDMVALEKAVRSVTSDGLLWGQSKLVPVAFGVKKLQIGCVVEDDKIGTDFLEESITAFEDFVQSVDVVGFNKI